MSAEPTPIRECDATLDYLYGLLEGDAKARFETHLATCTRCQERLADLGRVRVIAKEVLAPEEPSERLTGALHVQLMHAASQRTPPGKVLPFMRRLFQHPAYAAAAGILVIGGVVGLELSRDKLVAPPPPMSAAPEAKAIPTPAVAVDAPVATPPAVTAKAEEKKPTPEPKTAPLGTLAKGKGKADEDVYARYQKDAVSQPGKAPYGGYQSSSSTRSAPLDDLLNGGEAREHANKKVAAVGLDTSSSLGGPTSDVQPHGMKPHNAMADGVAGSVNEDRRGRPQEPRAIEAKEEAAKRDSEAQNSSPPPAPATTLVQPQVAAAPASEPNDEQDKPKRQLEPNVNRLNGAGGASTPVNGLDGIDAERDRSSALAQAGRCDEAVTIYQSLERRVPSRLTPQDRLSYERCLRALGRLEPAQNELDQLRAHHMKSRMPAAAVEAEQRAINVDRKRQALQNNAPAATAKRKRSAPIYLDADTDPDAAKAAVKH